MIDPTKNAMPFKACSNYIKLLFVSVLCLLTHVTNAIGDWNQMADFGGSARHRAIGFSIGNKGYIGLGHYNSGISGEVIFGDLWEYDPATNAWTQKADYLGGPSYAATAFVIDNFVYVGSGTGPFTFPFYKYDSTVNSWSNIALPPSGNLDGQSFTIGDKGYFVTLFNTYEYHPASDNWITKSPPPITGMSWYSCFGTGDDGFILYPNNIGFYEYEPTMDSWIIRDSFPGPLGGRVSSFPINGNPYILSGLGSEWQGELWMYNISSELWEPKEEFPGTSRRFSAVFSLNNMGYIGTGTNGTNFNDFWRYTEEQASLDKQSAELLISPNPTNGDLFIRSSLLQNDNTRIQVTNANGKEAKHSLNKLNNQTIQITVSGSSGVYFIKITSQGTTLYKRIVKL